MSRTEGLYIINDFQFKVKTGSHPVSDKEVDGGHEFLSLKIRQVDMVGLRPHADGLSGHDLGNAVHLLLVLRRIPDGAEILPSHRLIKMRKHLSVHVEQVLEQRIGTVSAHVGEDVEIQQGVSIAEIAQIYPIYLAIRRNDIAGIKVSVQTGVCRLQSKDSVLHGME